MDSSLHAHERTGLAHLTCGYPGWASLFTGVDVLRRWYGGISAGSQRTLAGSRRDRESRATPKCWPTPAWSVKSADDGCGGGSTQAGWRPSAERSALRSHGFFEAPPPSRG